MPNAIEHTLSTLLPTLTLLPSELLNLSASLLAQSRAKAANLKQEEEIGRTYACCHIACQRLGHKLGLEIAKPAPPCKPKVYNKLHGYFNAVLATPRTPRKGVEKVVETTSSSVPEGGRSGRSNQARTPSKAATATRTAPAATPATGKRTRGREQEVDVPAFVMPMIRHVCKAFSTPEPAPHVFVGVRSVLQARTSVDEQPSAKRRRTTTQTPKAPVQEDTIPDLVAAVFSAVSDRMGLRDSSDAEECDKDIAESVKEYCMHNGKNIPIDYPEDSDTYAAMQRISEDSLPEWEQMEWYTNIPQPDEEDEAGNEDKEATPRPATKPTKTPLRRKEKHAKRDPADIEEVGASGLLPGLGTMFQPALDWLSDDRREEYASWKEGILRQLAVVRQRA
ncbi:origin recognition complex subunit 6-domain-containing protein [Neohortaea acidophila]|uniref:Origin recognition complex subunit 6-domain-containing protein n=1 Tax=Neohortaea acidophila TaxID=245834 RepID=A0A6A6PY66_9PEZI|nr:origin recognition complex subunit 6-domain-containing protein [Neohortaea acidophila]KAF2484669.1 origin recognition complex subunit 6-domain-containing protein [Neohortaea acidophila]